MKLNTKNCDPIQGTPEAMIRPNKYISDDESIKKKQRQGEDDTTTSTSTTPSPETGESSLGRERKYLPTIIYTPAMTSKRIDQRRRLISYDGIEELNRKLGDLFLENSSSKGSEEESREDQSKKEDESHGTNDKTTKDEESLLGRAYKTVFSYKTCKSSQVLRSTRSNRRVSQ